MTPDTYLHWSTLLNTKVIPYVLMTGFFFGSSLISSRFALGQFSALTFVFFRLLVASACFLIVYAVNRKNRPWPTNVTLWRHGFILGITSTAVPMFSFVSALNYLSSGVTSIINTTGPALTVVLAHFLLTSESLTKRKIVGVALAFGGALMLALRGETGLGAAGGANPLGYIFVLVGLLCVSGSTIYVRKYAQDMDSFDLTSSQIFFAAIFLLPIILFSGGFEVNNLNGQGVFALAYGGIIGTVAAFWMFYYSVRRFGAIAGAMIPYVVPVAATLGGVIVLGEKITMGTLIGMGIIALGVTVINSRKRVREK